MRAGQRNLPIMTPFLYDCPVTSQKVQGWLRYEPATQDEGVYETVTCLACRGTHLINPKTGKAVSGPTSLAQATIRKHDGFRSS